MALQWGDLGWLFLGLLFVFIILAITVKPVQEKVVDAIKIVGQSFEKIANMIGIKVDLGSDLPEGESCDISYCGFSVLRPPSLTQSQIERILEEAESPAVGTGWKFVRESERTGIDNAIAMAFFKHESNYGTKGVARTTLSVGNIRYTSKCKDTYSGKEYKGFCQYPSWEKSIEAWYDLIKDVYVGKGRDTISEIIEKYAPCSDNDVQGYVASIMNFMGEHTDVKMDTCPLP